MKLYRITPTPLAVKVITHAIGIEGDYSNNKDDLGKATRYGITEATAKDHDYLWPLYNFNGDMSKLPKELAFHIYYVSWWNKMKLERIGCYSPELAELMFDFGINSGPVIVLKRLQEILNNHNQKGTLYDDLLVDGVIGPKTLFTVESFLTLKYGNMINKLLFTMHGLRTAHLHFITVERERNETFMNGWTTREYNLAKAHSKAMFE